MVDAVVRIPGRQHLDKKSVLTILLACFFGMLWPIPVDSFNSNERIIHTIAGDYLRGVSPEMIMIESSKSQHVGALEKIGMGSDAEIDSEFESDDSSSGEAREKKNKKQKKNKHVLSATIVNNTVFKTPHVDSNVFTEHTSASTYVKHHVADKHTFEFTCDNFISWLKISGWYDAARKGCEYGKSFLIYSTVLVVAYFLLQFGVDVIFWLHQVVDPVVVSEITPKPSDLNRKTRLETCRI